MEQFNAEQARKLRLASIYEAHREEIDSLLDKVKEAAKDLKEEYVSEEIIAEKNSPIKLYLQSLGFTAYHIVHNSSKREVKLVIKF